jgi:hypothetical protein
MTKPRSQQISLSDTPYYKALRKENANHLLALDLSIYSFPSFYPS